MNISLKWLRTMLDTDLNATQLSEVLTDIGLEVESIENVESVKGGLVGLVVGEVLEKEKHPDADRLSVTKVNVGESEPLQIVCGAANVAAGQKVVVALNGATLYPSEGESFKIKKSKIRGIESNGMICAEDEIGLGNSHEGIMVLDPSAVPGTPAAQYFNLSNDEVISIGLTPNRVDAASHFGVARDLNAALNFRGHKAVLKKPEVNGFSVENHDLSISVRIDNTDACKRYAGVSISGVHVEPSPEWMQNALKAIGLRPINNIVDITNYVLHELGHPLHAFDADKISGKSIVVRKAAEGTVFTTLDGTERKLSANDTMICDAANELCIAGVFGGADSGVTEQTKNIFLESAWFEPTHVRKTARFHGLNTDSSFRFERGADPEMVLVALKRAALLIREIAGGKISSEIVDVYPEKINSFHVAYDLHAGNRLIGEEISSADAEQIFTALEIGFSKKENGIYDLQVPAYRVDVQRPVDVTEDILRIYGYNRVALPARVSASLNHAQKPDKHKVRELISDLLSAKGFYEIMSNSLTSSHYSRIAGTDQVKEEFNVQLLNPLSSELDVMRQTLLFSGLEAVAWNKNRQQHDLRFYEIGSVYAKYGEKYHEEQRMSILLTGRREPENWNASSNDASYYSLKSAVEFILERLGLMSAAKYTALNSTWFEDGQRIEIARKTVAELGWIKPDLLKKNDIKQTVFFADIHWDTLLSFLHMNKVKYREIPKFPEVRRDLSLLLDKKVTFAEIEQLALQSEKKLLRSVGLFDVYEGKNLDAGKKSYALSFVLQDDEQTLTDQVIDQVMEKIRKSLEEKLAAQLRQ
jgi:phenylalanyl-tRNA synthetase beta chain